MFKGYKWLTFSLAGLLFAAGVLAVAFARYQPVPSASRAFSPMPPLRPGEDRIMRQSIRNPRVIYAALQDPRVKSQTRFGDIDRVMRRRVEVSVSGQTVYAVLVGERADDARELQLLLDAIVDTYLARRKITNSVDPRTKTD